MTTQIVTDHDAPELTPDLATFAAEWDRAAWLAKLAALFGPDEPPPPPTPARTHVTAQMIADIWQDAGPCRVREILAALDEPARARLVADYWSLLRRRGHEVSLVEIGIQLCVVERLAA